MNYRLSLAALTTGALLAISIPAFAQDGECTSDADCPSGFSCEEIGWESCVACEPGTECPPCEGGSSSYCVPPPPEQCDADNACEGGNVCVTYTFEACSGSGARPVCPDNDPDCVVDDEPIDEPTCETSSESYCVPPYLAPCSADADCGAGFTCEAAEVCSCDAGPPSTGTDGEPAPPDEPSCSCEPTGDNYCRLIEVECTSDADCAAGLTCQEMWGGATDIACAEGESCPEPEPVESVSYCAPPDYGYYGGVAGGGDYSEAVATAAGHEDANVTGAEREEFFPVDGEPGSGDKSSPGGCSTAGGGAGGSLLFLLAGLALGRRRR